jgi:hypothetical protein
LNVCPECFSAKGLRRRLEAERPSFPHGVRCDYHPTKKGIPVEAVAAIIDPVFRENFVGGPYDPYYDRHVELTGVDLEDTLRDLTGADDGNVVD